jgi:O-phosphoseryl-tRNA(Cys) synthetase
MRSSTNATNFRNIYSRVGCSDKKKSKINDRENIKKFSSDLCALLDRCFMSTYEYIALIYCTGKMRS